MLYTWLTKTEDSLSTLANLPFIQTNSHLSQHSRKGSGSVFWFWVVEAAGFLSSRLHSVISFFRGGMVQTSEQYEFVHHALSLYESRLSAEAVEWSQEGWPTCKISWGNLFHYLPAASSRSLLQWKERLWSHLWKDCVWFGKSIKIAGPLLYMNVCKLSKNDFSRGYCTDATHGFHAYLKGGFISVITVSAMWTVCMCYCCSQLDTGTSTEEMFIKCINALTFANSVLWMDCQLLNCTC